MTPIRDWNPQGKVLIATDHGGYALKNALCAALRSKGREVEDMGPHALDPEDDYPDYASAVASAIAAGRAERGILVCRSGVGMDITANRFRGVRAVLASNPAMARRSREHNCSNVLVLGGDCLPLQDALEIAEAWLATPYSGEPRHTRRLEKIERLSWDEIAPLRPADPEVAALLDAEASRQAEGIELIASENFASAAVRAAQGSVLTNKYAEGYPGRRYYNGCERVDEVEALAIARAKALFGAEAVNVQPHSGSQANMAAYFAVLAPGDTILAMDLAHGGHLTHGHPLNFSGALYKIVSYGVSRETETIDYDEVARLAAVHRPKLLVAGASAYPRAFDFARLRAAADAGGALLLVDMAHIAGLVAAGLHPSPVPYADIVTTTTHKTLRGPRGGMILCKERFIKEINSKLFPGIQGGPLMHVIAAKAVCLKEAAEPAFREYQGRVKANAAALAADLAARGFRIVSGGTDNHLMLVDLRPRNATGRAVSDALDKARITVNKNMIPFDPEKPMVTSGIRIGTPAVTTRGMGLGEMRRVAEWIDRGVAAMGDDAALSAIGREVSAFMRDYPMPAFF